MMESPRLSASVFSSQTSLWNAGPSKSRGSKHEQLICLVSYIWALKQGLEEEDRNMLTTLAKILHVMMPRKE